jgi:TolA-binding protein
LQKEVDNYWDREYIPQGDNDEKFKNMTYDQVKEKMVKDLKDKKDELKQFENEILAMNQISNTQNQIIEEIESNI